MAEMKNNYKLKESNLMKEEQEKNLRDSTYFGSPFEHDISLDESYLEEARDLEELIRPMQNKKNKANKQPANPGMHEKIELTSEQVDSYLKHIFKTAVKYNSTDVHIDNVDEFSRVRYRVDRKLITDNSDYMMNHKILVQRLKLMGEIFLSEDSIIQRGYAQYRISIEKIIDFSVITLPTRNGEKIVLKLKDDNLRIPITEIGMMEDDLKEVDKILEKSSGLVIVTGLSRSGKSTTLYSILERLSSGDSNILTIERKIFDKIEGVSQISMEEQNDDSVSEILKNVGDFDIDVLIIDAEFGLNNLKNVLNIVLSGKLVIMTAGFSTAYDVIVGLTSMGIEPYTIAASLAGIIAQNLVRKLCPICLGRVSDKRSEMQGCQHCDGEGFKGKTAVFEVFKMGRSYWPLILNMADYEKLKIAIRNERCSFENNCKKLVTAGVTSVSEIVRIGVGKNLIS